MRISKADAAKRQLDAAIELYFADSDPVAIHTLAAAAYELVMALRVRAGLSDEIMDRIVPERRNEFRKLWHEAQNFFKHADQDGDAILEFDPAQTKIRLFMASLHYDSIGPRTEAMVIFQVWFSMHNIDVMLDAEIREALERARPRWMHMPRAEFRRMMAQGFNES